MTGVVPHRPASPEEMMNQIVMMTTADDSRRWLVVDTSQQLLDDDGNYILRLADDDMFWFDNLDAARFHVNHGATVLGRVTTLAIPI